MGTLKHVRIRSVSTDDGISDLRKTVTGKEMKYGRTSEGMRQRVADGEQHDTPEIATWLSDYRALKMLEERSGHTHGAPMKPTKRSMRAS